MESPAVVSGTVLSVDDIVVVGVYWRIGERGGCGFGDGEGCGGGMVGGLGGSWMSGGGYDVRDGVLQSAYA